MIVKFYLFLRQVFVKMFKTIQLNEGEEKYCVNITATITDDGLMVHLTGGDRPHVGAVVMSLPRPSLENPSEISCTSYVLPRFGHKDDEVAKPLAEKLARHYNTTVVVVAGIHIKNADKSDIQRAIESVNRLTRKLIVKIDEYLKQN